MIVRADSDAIEIGTLYREARDLYREGIINSIPRLLEAGRRLAAKKKSLKHGEWLPWLTANADALGFGTRATAMRLMKEASKWIVNDPFDGVKALEISRQMWGNQSGPIRGVLGTGDDEWNTPVEYIEKVRTVLGKIELSPASNAFAQSRVHAGTFYTKEDDGLSKPWRGKVFMNPPYSQPLISQFIDRLIKEYQTGNVPEAILLTNSNMDAEWFHAAWRAASVFCGTRGRVKFEKPDSVHNSPICGQTFFYFGPHPEKFVKIFAHIGTCAKVWA